MIDVTVKVPEDRLADFYAMYGQWLAGDSPRAAAEMGHAEPRDWSNSVEDAALAAEVWPKFSVRAKGLYSLLMDNPGTKFDGEELANTLDIPNGKYGTAGVLAWPGRHCAAVGRRLPSKDEEGLVGESSKYWMTAEVAALFTTVRDTVDA